MTMRFGRLQCVRCSMVGHLSYQCKKPVVDLPKPEDNPPAVEQPVMDSYDQYNWHEGVICIKEAS